MLDLLCETIVVALGFGVAVINLVRPDGSLEVVSVAGDDDARALLLGTSDSGDTWDRLLELSEPWGELRFVDHKNTAADGLLSWFPDIVPIDADDAWHPDDALFAPLTAADGKRIGVLSVDVPAGGRRPGPVTCRALEAFTVATALAIENSTLRARAEASEQRYRYLSTHDQLTGVGNRSILFDRLQHAVTGRPGSRSLTAVIFVDLDGFKAINDTHSHLAGDHLLLTVAHRIESVVRPHDTVVRWGGDEFLILLEQLEDRTAALAVAQRISSAIAEPIGYYRDEFHITASMGVAFHNDSDDIDADELVNRADAAMYRVKRGGRNDWAVFGPTDQAAPAHS
jgi:diguanylate cyclase (GGDEF)-like protein